MSLDFVVCPFNKQHKVPEKNLQRHIIRCMVNYPSFVSCYYNNQHWFENKEKMLAHIPQCRSKPLDPNVKPITTSVTYQRAEAFENVTFHKTDEDWDAEYN